MYLYIVPPGETKQSLRYTCAPVRSRRGGGCGARVYLRVYFSSGASQSAFLFAIL